MAYKRSIVLNHKKAYPIFMAIMFCLSFVLNLFREYWVLSSATSLKIQVSSKQKIGKYGEGPRFVFFDENNYKYHDTGYFLKGTIYAGSFYKFIEIGKCYDVEYSIAHINEDYGRSVIHVAPADCDTQAGTNIDNLETLTPENKIPPNQTSESDL